MTRPMNFHGRRVAADVSRESARFTLDGRLVPTDRVMQRWAVSVGSGLPSAPWDESRKSTLDPLDDETAMVVDRIICHAPPMTKRLIREWYCGCGSATVVGRKIGVSRRTAYMLVSEALGFLGRQFVRSGHAGLMGLLKLERVP